MKQFLDKLKNKQDLTFDESKSAFEVLMTGKATDDEIYNFLTLLSDKGEVSDEIAGGVYVLREKSKRVNVSDCIDTCGTGGDGMNTLNISTASALLLASMDIKVAKHGNRGATSKSGSADVLEAAGVNLEATADQVAAAIQQVGVGFMFAPAHHSAMKHVINARKEIGVRTVFNLLGPLTNPAGAPNQIMGVFGQTTLAGKRIKKSVDNRTLPHFHRDDDTPEARGFVFNN